MGLVDLEHDRFLSLRANTVNELNRAVSGAAEAIQQAFDTGVKAGRLSRERHVSVLRTIQGNVHNEKLSDADFRAFVESSLEVVDV